jgi:rhamnogalacturonan endolyase
MNGGLALHLLRRGAWTLVIGGAIGSAACALGQTEQPKRSAESADRVELFADDFSRFPPGPLTAPLGKLNGAIQEYHYLANRGVDLGPWANAICHIDAWAAGDEDGRCYVEQHLAPTHQDMVPELFAPILLTGEAEWRGYDVEVDVCPLSTAEFAGVVFRYHTNRHHCLFALEGGKRARLAVRLPLEEEFRVGSWRELASTEFVYETNRYYRLRIENRGTEIRAYVDDRLVLSASETELMHGKAGLSANAPARFRDFRVTATSEIKKGIEQAIAAREAELAKLRAANPRPVRWRKFATPQFGAGRNVRFGDLDCDGQTDMLIGQNVPKVVGDAAVEISCLTAVTLEGRVLWQSGRPDPRNALLTCDTPFQIHDFDGDGTAEVVLTKDFKLQVLDGATGQPERAVPLPKVASYPDVPQSAPPAAAHERLNGDSLVFVNFSGDPGRRELVVKDRYWNFWVFDHELKLLWQGDGMLGHYPFPVADAATGRDHLAIGYALWDASGKQLWTNDQRLHQHADSIFIGNLTDDPEAPPVGYYCCSDDGVLLVDDHGVIRRQHGVGHAQTAAIGKFLSDAPGLQYVTINFWRNPGIVSVFDARGNLLSQDEPIHSGSPLRPVNWRGDGQEFILLSGNVREGGMVDGDLRRVVMFPDDGHPDLCADVLDLTGDARDEIVLWDQDEVWIYTQDAPFAGEHIYSPRRNPSYNDSNYRVNASLPAWQEAAP